MNTLDKNQYHYTSLFCEENIWKLIESCLDNSCIIPIDVLFIINQFNSIALLEQQKSISEQAVVWDYHVVLSAQIENQLVILDFDSRCKFPCKINTYFNSTFANYNNLPNHYRPFLKPIAADYYYQNFTSDRSHMQGIIPQSEFPAYDIILPNNTDNLLSLETCRAFNSAIRESYIQTPLEYLQHLKSATAPNP